MGAIVQLEQVLLVLTGRIVNGKISVFGQIYPIIRVE